MRIRIFCLCLVLSIWAFPSFSQDYNRWDFEVDGIRYRVLSENTCTIVSLTSRPPLTLTLPSTVTTPKGKTYYITEIYSLTRYLSQEDRHAFRKITSVHLPERLRSLDGLTFEDCSQLRYIQLPSTLRFIGGSTFAGCSLRTVKLPEGIQRIDTRAFAGCPLTEIEIPGSCTFLGDRVFESCWELQTIRLKRSSTTLSLGNRFLLNSASHVIIERPVDAGRYPLCFIGHRTIRFDNVENVEFVIGTPDVGENDLKFYFGENTKSINIGGHHPAEFHLSSPNPPVTNGFPDSFYLNTDLTVPKGSISAYKKAPYWKKFFSIEEGSNSSSK